MVGLLVVVIAAAIGIFAAIQIASFAVFSAAGAAGSFPSHLAPALGERLYRAIARVAPAPYVIDMIVRADIARDDVGEARADAQRLPQGPARDEWLAKIAARQRDERSALAFFLRAGDEAAVQQRIDTMVQTRPRAAFSLERALASRMMQGGDHPDAYAEATWNLGRISDRLGKRRDALQYYRRAAELAPLSAKYLLSLADEEDALGDRRAAVADRRRAREVDPRLEP